MVSIVLSGSSVVQNSLTYILPRIGNVAAGADNSGFWFDTRNEPRGPSRDLPAAYDEKGNFINPMVQPIGEFRDNVAHSNKISGITYYRPGWRPADPEKARIINSNVYRNRKSGHLVHANLNIIIQGGIVADNMKGFHFFQNGDILIENVKIIGRSQNLLAVMEGLPKNTRPWCPYYNRLVALEMHPWRLFVTAKRSLTARNIEFSGLMQEGCHGAAIRMNNQHVFKKVYDSRDRFENMVSPPIDILMYVKNHLIIYVSLDFYRCNSRVEG